MAFCCKQTIQNAGFLSSSVASNGGQKRSVGSRLGTYGNTVVQNEDHPTRQERRKALWRLQRKAVELLFPKGTPVNELKGTATCRWAVQSKNNGVDVAMTTYTKTGDKRASFRGLQTCGKIWTCPCCAQRISETRRTELNQAMKFAHKNELHVRMATFTSQHSEEDDLSNSLEGMKLAKRRFEQRRDYREFKKKHLIGSVTATEVTHGKNGWHVHFHVIYFMNSIQGADFINEAGDAWRAALRGVGMYGASAAYDCQKAEQAAGYIAKWGAAEELTLSGKKKAKKGGKNPLQILEAYAAGSEEAGELWLEYAHSFSGKKQLSWSRGLKALVGIGDISDEQAASDEAQEDQQDDGVIINIDNRDWRSAGRHRRTRILDAAENDGVSGVEEVLSDVWDEKRKQIDPSESMVVDTDDAIGKAFREIMENRKKGGLAAAAISLIKPPEANKSQSYPQNIAAP